MSMNAVGQGRPDLQISRGETGSIKQNSLRTEDGIKEVKKEELTQEEMDKAIEKLNTFLKDENTYAEYKVHDKFNQVMIKIINSNTKEVILEIPPKKILDLVAKMCEMVGILVDEKA